MITVIGFVVAMLGLLGGMVVMGLANLAEGWEGIVFTIGLLWFAVGLLGTMQLVSAVDGAEPEHAGAGASPRK